MILGRFVRYFGLLPLRAGTLLLVVFLISTFQVAQRYTYHLTSNFDFGFSWLEITTRVTVGNLIWVILSPLLLIVGRDITSGQQFFTWRRVGQLLSVVTAAIVQQSVALWLYNLSFYFQSGYMRNFFGANNQSDLISGFFTSFVEGVVIIGVFVAIDYQRKLANKERDLVKAQLNALKMQLHPHFLFNTLHSISSMIDIDLKLAQQMITKVGDMLRTMLAHNEDDFVSLKEEIDFIRNYLELEQIRFQDRMEIGFEVDDQVIESKVPNLILQPLAENCIKHGVAKSAGSSRISVNASVYSNGSQQQWLKLEVNNSGEFELPADSRQGGFGIGLKNVEDRLRENYGEAHFCDFRKIDNHRYKAEIRIPLEK